MSFLLSVLEDFGSLFIVLVVEFIFQPVMCSVTCHGCVGLMKQQLHPVSGGMTGGTYGQLVGRA